MVTGLFAALFALGQIILSLLIVRLRMKHKVSLGDGGVPDLQSMMRVHGNFTETVPMALILMGLAELGGAPFAAVYGMGVMMVFSRLIHAYALLTPPGYGTARKIGMSLTFLTYTLGAGICFWFFIVSL
ncbi:MAG: MAPEG family protein [Alphaproteobacteria bacterium]|nr:MAPEG family protein [Alphaproteobacteria bacterium]MCD8571464.1 MAPEG family protein [Alphaproteobacteria bacterium]